MYYSDRSPYHPSQSLRVKIGAYWGEKFGRDTRDNAKNEQRGNRILGALTVLTALGTITACNTGPEKTETDESVIECNFSPETTIVTVDPNQGLDAIAMEIDGVDEYGNCLTSAKWMIQQLNPDYTYLRAPRMGDELAIPVSVDSTHGDD